MRGYGEPLIEYLTQQEKFRVRLHAPLEGSVIVPYEPAVTIEAPLPFIRLAEGVLTASCNAPTQLMTVANRTVRAGAPGIVMEFGRRKSLCSVLTSLYCHLGGVRVTSNEEVADIWDIPGAGTVGHEWPMGFGREQMGACESYLSFFGSDGELSEWVARYGSDLASFDAQLEVDPNSPILIVDTINTLRSGVPNAILAFKRHRERIAGMSGIRIDSGRLAWLTLASVKMLDEAELSEVRIALSGDLDEYRMEEIKREIRDTAHEFGFDAEEVLARIIWGVGSRLVTCANDPAFRGAAKLSEVEGHPTLKISNTLGKSSIPGNLRSAWIWAGGELLCVLAYHPQNYNVVSDKLVHLSTGEVIEDLQVFDKDEKRKALTIPKTHVAEPRQRMLFDSIRRPETATANWARETLDDVIARVGNQVSQLHPAALRLHNPWSIKLSLTPELFGLRHQMMELGIIHESMLPQ